MRAEKPICPVPAVVCSIPHSTLLHRIGFHCISRWSGLVLLTACGFLWSKSISSSSLVSVFSWSRVPLWDQLNGNIIKNITGGIGARRVDTPLSRFHLVVNVCFKSIQSALGSDPGVGETKVSNLERRTSSHDMRSYPENSVSHNILLTVCTKTSWG